MIIDAKFKPVPGDAEANGRAGAFAALKRLKQVEELVANIKDPETGAHPTMTWNIVEDGITISFDGSDCVVAEMQRRLHELPA